MKALIQPGVFGDEEQPLIAALSSRGIKVEIEANPDKFSGTGEPYFVRGTLEYYDKVLEKAMCGIIPKVTESNYEWMTYTRMIDPDALMNNHWVCFPWWKLQDPSVVESDFGGSGIVFIRPNSGRKLFTGTTVKTNWWVKELQIIKNLPWSRIAPETLVIVAPYQEILAEFRLLMYRDEIIDFSRYDDNGADINLKLSDARSLVSSIFHYPDAFYSLDVAITEDGAKILELNSLACAGWYDCDPGRVIDKIMDVNGCNEFCIGSKK